MPGQLPPLRQVPIPQDPEALPRTLIRSDSDVQEWRLTQSYRDYTLFLQRLNEAVVGRFLPWEGPEPSEVCRHRQEFHVNVLIRPCVRR